MILDSSVLLAVIFREPGHEDLLATIWEEDLPPFNELIRDVKVPALAPAAAMDQEGSGEGR